MDMSGFSGSAFRKPTDADLKAGPKRLKIVSVEIGKFEKPNIKFNDGSILSANGTNVKELIRAFGADSEGWIGRDVELFVGETLYQGTAKSSVLINATPPAVTATTQTQPAPKSKRA